MGVYLDSLTIRVESYPDGYPLPENLVEGFSLQVHPTDTIDRAALIEQINSALETSGRPRVVTESYRQISWGAAGAVLDVVVQVAGNLAAAGIVAIITEALRRQRVQRAPAEVDSDVATARARDAIASALNCPAEDTTVLRAEHGPTGWTVEIQRDESIYRVELATDDSLTFRRTTPGPPAPPE